MRKKIKPIGVDDLLLREKDYELKNPNRLLMYINRLWRKLMKRWK